jgi:hypothetical protein
MTGDAAGTVISGAVEGDIDEAVLTRIVEHAGAQLGPIRGRTRREVLLSHLFGYNEAARMTPWAVLIDLDDDDCAPVLLRRVLPAPAQLMRCRVVVREIESWLMSDATALAKFLSIPENRVPAAPEAELDAQAVMVELAAASRRKDIRMDMVPRAGSGRKIGPAYNSRLSEFALTDWRVETARSVSDSLRRCVEAIRSLTGA